MNTLTNETRAQYRRALIIAKQSTAGLTDAELEAAHNKLRGIEAAQHAHKIESIPAITAKKTPETESKTEKVRAANDDHVKLAELIAKMVPQGPALDESRIIELIQQHSSAPRAIDVRVIERDTTTKTATIATPHKALENVLKMAACRVNIYAHGPAGAGKTTLAQQVAECLNLSFFYTGAVLQKYELLGFVDAQGVYQATPFYLAYKVGGVFLFDELDASFAGALVAFNAALDNGICQFPNGELIKKHKDFVCMATANTLGKGANRKYIGRNQLDGATLDRYVFVELDYCPIIEEENAVRLFLEFGGAELYGEKSEYVGREIAKTVQHVRAQAEKMGLNCIISPRASFDAAKLVAVGISVSDALNATLYSKLGADERAQLGA